MHIDEEIDGHHEDSEVGLFVIPHVKSVDDVREPCNSSDLQDTKYLQNVDFQDDERLPRDASNHVKNEQGKDVSKRNLTSISHLLAIIVVIGCAKAHKDIYDVNGID
jgi:hypothetical protein